MNFQEAVRTCLVKYADFNGRASRPEMWFGMLAWVGVLFIASVLDTAVFGISIDGFGVFYTLTALGLFLPGLAVQVRRLHDTDRSGWWVLISLVPIVGVILLIVWWCQPGTGGTNRFGSEPATAPGDGAPGPRAPRSAPQTGDLERLERLHALRESGALTDEEFAAEKAKLLQL